MRKLIKELGSLKKETVRLLVLGPLPVSKKILADILKEQRPNLLLFVDGGLDHKKLTAKLKGALKLAIGDGDSIKSSAQEIDILLPKEKDYSDLVYVTTSLTKAKLTFTSASFLGFSAHQNEKRFDHLLFNLKALEIFATKNKLPVTLDEHFIILPAGIHNFQFKGTWSLLTFSRAKIKISGHVAYPLTKWTNLEILSTLGLSNESTGKFRIENDKTVLFYKAFFKTSS